MKSAKAKVRELASRTRWHRKTGLEGNDGPALSAADNGSMLTFRIESSELKDRATFSART